MTNLAILSDIHGNIPALEAVLADLAAFKIDHVIAPGDVISFGPFSRQAAEWVIENGWSVIRGTTNSFLSITKRLARPRNGTTLSNLLRPSGFIGNSTTG